MLGLVIGYQVGRTTARPPDRSYGGADGERLTGVARQVRVVLLEPDLLVRNEKLAGLLQKLGPESLGDVREGFDSIFMDLGDTDQVLLAEWWARFDPAGAFDWAQSTWQAEHPAVAEAILRAWARRDPAAALAKAMDLPSEELQIRLTQACLAGWEEAGAPGLLEWIKARPPGPGRQMAIDVVARRKVLREGPAAAFLWAERLDDDDELFKLNVLRRVASSAAEVEPAQAASWVETLIGGKFESGAPQRVGTRWARREPEAALKWLSTLPPGQARDDAVRETVRRWFKRDPEAALAYIENVEWEPWLDPAAALMSRRLAGKDLPKALEWAERIQEGDLRWYSIGVIVRAWAFQDEAAARAYVAQANLPDYLERKVFEVPDHLRPGGARRAVDAAHEAAQEAAQESEAEPSESTGARSDG